MTENIDPLGSYLALLREKLTQLETTQRAALERAAEAVAETLVNDGLVHVFGSGHSHMVAEELFYRAGGLGAINPILESDLMLHESATGSTQKERQPGRGHELFDRLNPDPVDTLIVISNSGGNQIALELAERARANGMAVIAIVSLQHVRSGVALRDGVTTLDQLATITIDNLGVAGDAAIELAEAGVVMGPTSSVIGVTIANSIAMTAVSIAARAGVRAGVFSSSNVAGGDERNRELIARYQSRVVAL